MVRSTMGSAPRGGSRRVGTVVLFALAVAAACTGVDEPIDYQFTVDEVDVDVLPAVNPLETYHYRFPSARADSLLRALLNSRIPVNEAWEPTVNTCANPDDPRFTVVLENASSRMDDFDFDLGEGLQGCTVRVRRYQVTRMIF